MESRCAKYIKWFVVVFLMCWEVSVVAEESSNLNTQCEKPVTVQTSVEVLDLRNIDTINHTFDIDFYLLLRWNPQDSVKLNADKSYEGDWRPIPDFINAVSLENKTPSGYSQIEQISATESVFDGRYSGTFTSTMNFKEFPHDEQTLQVIIEDYDMNASCMQFVFEDTDKNKQADECGEEGDYDTESFGSLVDWQHCYTTQLPGTHRYEKLEDAAFSQAVMTIGLKRLPQFYNFKIVSICVIITIISWLAFALNPGSLGERTSISVTSFLALVAHNYVSTDMLPKIPYLTALDTVLVGTQILVFISSMQNLLVFLLFRTSTNPDKERICKRIDRYSVAAFAVVLVVLLIAYSRGYSLGYLLSR